MVAYPVHVALFNFFKIIEHSHIGNCSKLVFLLMTVRKWERSVASLRDVNRSATYWFVGKYEVRAEKTGKHFALTSCGKCK